MKVQAKFKLQEVTEFSTYINFKNDKGNYDSKEAIGNRLKFQVVTKEKPENEVFATYTPYGTLEVVVLNPDLVGKFKTGKEYLFDITEAE